MVVVVAKPLFPQIGCVYCVYGGEHHFLVKWSEYHLLGSRTFFQHSLKSNPVWFFGKLPAHWHYPCTFFCKFCLNILGFSEVLGTCPIIGILRLEKNANFFKNLSSQLFACVWIMWTLVAVSWLSFINSPAHHLLTAASFDRLAQPCWYIRQIDPYIVDCSFSKSHSRPYDR